MNEIKLSNHIRNSLKTARINKKIKATDICKFLGKHPSFISHIENGVLKTIDYEILKNIFSFILKVDHEELNKYIDELIIEVDEKVLTTSKKNSKQPNYQKLYEDHLEEQREKLNDAFLLIDGDLSNFPPDYNDCEDDSVFEPVEKFVTTFITIMSGNEVEVFDKFYELMKLPLFKLNPVQFQNLVDHANSLLEYEYVFESAEKSKTQHYPHFRVKYKKSDTAQ